MVLAGTALARRPWRQGIDARRGIWAAPLAMVLGYGVGVVWMGGKLSEWMGGELPEWEVGFDENWLIPAALVVAMLSIIKSRMQCAMGLCWLVFGIVFAATAVLTHSGFVRQDRGAAAVILIFAGFGVIGALVSVITQRLAAVWSQRGAMTALLIASVGMTGVLFLSGSVEIGKAGRLVCAVVGGVWLISMWDGRAALGSIVAPVCVLLLGGWAMAAYFTNPHDTEVVLAMGDGGLTGQHLVAAALVLAFVAPAAAWAGCLGFLRRRGKIWPMVIALGAVVVVAALAMGVTGLASPPFEAESSEYDY